VRSDLPGRGRTRLCARREAGFAAHVKLPERSYLRSSLTEMTEEIREGLSQVVVEAMG
jgi:hypothetical protein